MADVATYRRLRGAAKAKLTRLESKIDKASDNLSQEMIEEYIRRLDAIGSEFESAHREILVALTGDVTVVDTTEEAEFEERHFELKVKLKQWLNNATASISESRPAVSEEVITRLLQQQSEFMQHIGQQSGGSQASNASSDAITRLVEQQTEMMRRFSNAGGATDHETRVKLPIVKLPTFDGNTEEWKRFSETFQSLIHSNRDISQIQKFQYLVTAVTGDAAKIIESIELTAENYAIAWELLIKRYEDPRAIKKKHIQCLFTMPRVEKESSSGIRSLIDYTVKHLRVLKSMELPTDTWDDLVIHMIEAKLDSVTLRSWEQEGNPDEATFASLEKFLQKRCQMLERIEARVKQKDVLRKGESDKQQTKSRIQVKSTQGEKPAALTTATDTGKCYLCEGDHFLYRCEKFLSTSVEERLNEVRRLKLCINCLKNDHFVKSCKMGSCKECGARHNTLCHRPQVSKDQTKEGEGSSKSADDPSSKSTGVVAVHHASNGPQRRHVLMATAMVNATHANGCVIPIRILLDSGSEAHFITHAACNRLGVKRTQISEVVTGLNQMESPIAHSCEITIRSRHSDFSANVHCLVVPKITKDLPSIEINRRALKIPSNIALADPDFEKKGVIDMLMGAEFFYSLFESERINLGENLPILQNTRLGWIIGGTITFTTRASHVTGRDPTVALTCFLEQSENLDQTLRKFWEIENCQSAAKQSLSTEGLECEEFFEKTATRDSTGRFVVRLPFHSDPTKLGESRETARKRLTQLEKRFKSDPELRDRYVDFMREYLDTGHMSPVINASRDTTEHPIVYLPHHGVIKEASSTTKLRTVFDASAKTDSGISLNDLLRVGPNIQSSLIDVIMRFRFPNVALTGDMKKMYRQILIHPDDRDYQRIFWRFCPTEPVQEFRLNTVTYGQASSAYLAIKCIRKLAEEAKAVYPDASRVVLDQAYVDDIMAGAGNVEDATKLQEQLTSLLRDGGFEIHKWCSNRPEVLEQVPPDLRENTSKLQIGGNDTIKTLGLEWNPTDDQFQFSFKGTKSATTKRQILAAIGRFFDPLGLIGPILTTAKLLMQKTWQIECSWDDTLPTSFLDKWEEFRSQLDFVETLFIPRRVIPCEQPAKIYIQGFCDASESAYGACLYIQVEDQAGVLTSRILCSKSRVAPIKPTTIPRLELCSAVLLSHLVTNAIRALRVQIDGVQAWTDSQVALCWIRGDPSRWKPFVANRVMEIVEMLPAKHWNHVRGDENPADLISRGTSPRRLKTSELWWAGPPWLLERCPSASSLPQEFNSTNETLEQIEIEERKKEQVCNLLEKNQLPLQRIIDKFSSLTRAERVLAYCILYVSKLKRERNHREGSLLSAIELQEARRRLIKHVQAAHFSEEISALNRERELKPSSKILSLHPFLDDQGILRVGGRLQNSKLQFESQHPIILPSGAQFTRLLFEREHRRLLHAGQLLLLSSIREHYWPLRGRDIARQVCRSCVRCTRANPRELTQVMGPLPSDRVCPERAFAVTGVDFAGPFLTLVNKGRGRKTFKSYVALFVCFATKAIHLEATSELTTAAFLATLRRFIGRRGRPRLIHSDNATNFVGASHELKEMYDFAKTQVTGSVGEILSSEDIEWRFIPPRSPHMGGLWEAGVKACKYHLKRVMGNSLFTFEELTTALVQVEACLNSRPLSPLSSDPTDLQPLTPAHFLVGGPMTSLPDADVTEVRLNRLDRWRLIQRAFQDYWKRWSSEYVTDLQVRTKWKKVQQNLQINDMVIVREDNLPPLKWKLGRVSELHPGNDGLVRVATIRTADGFFKRAIAKLCKLPTSELNEEEISPPNLVGGLCCDDRNSNLPRVATYRSAEIADVNIAPLATATLARCESPPLARPHSDENNENRQTLSNRRASHQAAPTHF